MSIHDIDWSQHPAPTEKQLRDQAARDLARLRYLPYLLYKRQLEIALARDEVTRYRAQMKQYEKAHGKQPRSAWTYGDHMTAAKAEPDTRAAFVKLGQLVEAQRSAERVVERKRERRRRSR